MKVFTLMIIPISLSFWDCNKPREPSQPVSKKTVYSEVGMVSHLEGQIQKLIREATWH